MKMTIHITFFYIEDRIQYINRIIDETNTYHYSADLFIHTNKSDLMVNDFHTYTNGILTIIWHDLSDIHPHYLTWKCRDLLKKQKDDYDIFMYIEDDILVPYKAIQYWLKYHIELINKGYNLGFVRIEIKDKDGEEYMSDVIKHLHTNIQLDNDKYCVNNVQPYCAFWIYNKNEFHKFLNTEYYYVESYGYPIRESSAIGLHGLFTPYYKGTLIPIINDLLHPDCRVYHMPNNYANIENEPNGFARIKFRDAFGS
jgi:hypothetical protein